MKWKFDGYDIYFVSTNESLSKDILNAAKHLKISPTTKIIYEDNPNPESALGRADDSTGHTPDAALETIPVDPEQIEATDEASELRDMPGDVDDAIFATDPLEGTPNPDILSGDSISWNGLAE